MRKTMQTITAVSLCALLLSLVLYHATGLSALYSCAITFGTMFYHLAVRLLCGWTFSAVFHNQINAERRWFQPRCWEPALYRRLHVKRWKNHMPTFDPDTFSLQKHSLDEIIGVTCQSELVHECNIVLSAVPLFFSIWFDNFPVFLLTSLLAAAFDGIFVILQRYNRPRLQALAKRRHKGGVQ